MAGAVRRALIRIAAMLGVLWGAATLTFLAQHLMPGDPAQTILGGAGSKPSPEQLAAVNAQYGFDRPLLTQYVGYLAGLLRGDLGTSYVLKQPVADIIGQQVGPTLVLTITALAASWVIAVVVTLLTAHRSRVLSALGSGVEIILAALPQYWLGIVLLVVFAFQLHLFPVVGDDGVAGLVLPALTLALPLAGFLGQVTRDEFSTAMEQPFAVSARARGMSDWGVRWRHALRHAVLPGLSLSGWALGSLFSTAVIVEIVFVRPGLGRILVDAVTKQDMPVVVGVTLLVALVYVVANLVVDIAFVRIDPRLRRA
ncbi:ABC transporter permease [Mycolicibacterium conceptionense]|uniref:ABC transporter permease n=3 Tax=Mycobacteriaceae TaxID=1762 RepID=A0ABR5FRB6_9MYCO|nr:MULTISPECIES: ABC transporter permease [Mycolicibacterium]KLI08109.1 ABC transporter permease [Mycolicibacterium senegalense]KLO50496.1 ABC transporter permease [Mycolicibacterium senegalense]KMV18657.1 ABC transporter permease [Mycolicibacterium conceptionense]OBK09333.1 ABC transporter permease [Mycolicibacterium conceptionense]OMB80750.1 ABC transporter permease [Mycolicibacterium conceptionense]